LLDFALLVAGDDMLAALALATAHH
ncbi:MAG: hypothetical protein QOC60_29, partial [Frankiaceae bacterium]|nr:hypothetical protein [Frankiaceae bacterium]